MDPTTEWEERCLRCGRCCYEKIDCDGEISYTGTPCEFLDPESRLCTVYEERHRRKPVCTPLTPKVLAMGALPGDCPYVAGLEGYRPPLAWDGES